MVFIDSKITDLSQIAKRITMTKDVNAHISVT